MSEVMLEQRRAQLLLAAIILALVTAIWLTGCGRLSSRYMSEITETDLDESGKPVTITRFYSELENGWVGQLDAETVTNQRYRWREGNGDIVQGSAFAGQMNDQMNAELMKAMLSALLALAASQSPAPAPVPRLQSLSEGALIFEPAGE